MYKNIVNRFYFTQLFLLLTTASILSENPEWIVYNTSNSCLPDDRVLSIVIEENGDK